MDKELLLDFYGYLPEKYFVSRSLFREFQTRVSFVDYERKNYMSNYGSFFSFFMKPRIFWLRRGIICQEYGPTIYTKNHFSSEWLNQKGLHHRKNGPAIKNIQDCMFACGPNFYPKNIPCVDIRDVWCTDGIAVKWRTHNGEIIS